MRQRNFVTISTHLYPHDADLAVLKARIEAEGIPYFLQDQHYVAIAPLESLAIGGVKLRIFPESEGKVREIMTEMRTTPLALAEEIDPEEAAWMAERLHKERNYRARFNKWAPVIGAALLILSMLGILFKELFTTRSYSHNQSFSSQSLP
ncbi:MAG: hypothetical protein NWR72_00680 [Bacteroidia bacterium]|nr:hypothetical protein [Bacteroidia bacterium]